MASGQSAAAGNDGARLRLAPASSASAFRIDDARFDPLWDEAGRLHVPVFVHIAEPAAFYEPVNEKNELRRSANWSGIPPG